MEHSIPQDPTLLAHWIYTREEWKDFKRWRGLQKSMLHYLWHRIMPGRFNIIPEIWITSVSVRVNDQNEIFQNEDRIFQRVTIRDAGKLNVMKITYETRRNNAEIWIPIPKGKLKEAIQLQEELLYRHPLPYQAAETPFR